MKHFRTMTTPRKDELRVSGPAEAQTFGKLGIGTSLIATATFLTAKAAISTALTGLVGGGEEEG